MTLSEILNGVSYKTLVALRTARASRLEKENKELKEKQEVDASEFTRNLILQK